MSIDEKINNLIWLHDKFREVVHGYQSSSWDKRELSSSLYEHWLAKFEEILPSIIEKQEGKWFEKYPLLREKVELAMIFSIPPEEMPTSEEIAALLEQHTDKK